VIRIFARSIILSIALLLRTGNVAMAEDPVRVLVPPFNGEQFGANVGTVIYLKIFSTLGAARRDAWIFWSPDPLSDSTYMAAEERARDAHATFILWGSIVKFGKDFLAQPLLAIRQGTEPAEDDPTTWRVSLESGVSVLSLSVGIPGYRYDLPPLILTRDILELYDTTSSIKIYERRPDGALGQAIGEIGSSFKALKHDGNFFKVRNFQSGKEGWVALPKLGDEADVIDFVGGLISLFRRDYPGAINVLRNVSASSKSTILRIDSFLLQALAKAKMKEDPSALVDSALELDPYLQVSVKYKIMSLIEQMLSCSGDARQAKFSELFKQISESGYLFPYEDSWLATSKQIARAAKDP
jgi:hypothetical protein